MPTECESSKDAHCPCLAMGGVGASLPICLLLSWRTEEAGPCFVLCHPLDLPGLPRKPGVGEERGHNHGRKLNCRLRPSQLQKVDPKDGGCSLGESTQGLPLRSTWRAPARFTLSAPQPLLSASGHSQSSACTSHRCSTFQF